MAIPVLFVLWNLTADSGQIWSHLAETVLWRYLTNTALLAIGVAVVAAVVGIACAWLVSMCQFPGRSFFSWALLLPLAMPAYLLAYTYTDFFDYAGPIQTGLRSVFGWTSAQDYWFPNLRSVGGAVLVISMVLYPYVYLTCRAAFLDQSVCILEAGRTLGHGPWSCFRRLALPMARPAIVAGLSLVVMETLADYGTVDYFSVDTFTTGIYRTWSAYSPSMPAQAYAAATKLAAFLLLFVAIVLILERFTRGRKKFHHSTGRYRELPRWQLSGWKKWAALAICCVPITLGFILPAGILIDKAVHHPVTANVWQLSGNSLMVSSIAAICAVFVAIIIAYAKRMRPTVASRSAARLASLGYAIPGSVIAIAIITPLGWLDNAIDARMREWFNISTGLLLSGTLAALVFAYVARFLAAALGSVESGLERIRPNLDDASRTLGSRPAVTLWRVHMPLMLGSIATAGLIVFVDTMKELPATMIVRPFDFSTLAIAVYDMAGDERLGQAAVPALVIVAAGLIPVLLLNVVIARSRPGLGSPGP